MGFIETVLWTAGLSISGTLLLLAIGWAARGALIKTETREGHNNCNCNDSKIPTSIGGGDTPSSIGGGR